TPIYSSLSSPSWALRRVLQSHRRILGQSYGRILEIFMLPNRLAAVVPAVVFPHQLPSSMKVCKVESGSKGVVGSIAVGPRRGVGSQGGYICLGSFLTPDEKIRAAAFQVDGLPHTRDRNDVSIL